MSLAQGFGTVTSVTEQTGIRPTQEYMWKHIFLASSTNVHIVKSKLLPERL